VIAPDLRGFGRSPAPAASDGTTTMEQFADDTAGLLDALGINEPVVLCGLSMGGYVAFQFQRKYGSRLRGLVLCDTRAAADTPEVAAGRLETAEHVLREGPQALVDSMIPRLFAEENAKDQPEMVESLRRVMMATDRKTIAAASRGMAERPDVSEMLPLIDCPTLVVVGQSDAISPAEEMRSIAAAIPGARFVKIACCGHMSPIEAPAAVDAAISQFIDDL
jgi:pimeloyl-ACP methyl ester carboxylesterase